MSFQGLILESYTLSNPRTENLNLSLLTFSLSNSCKLTSKFISILSATKPYLTACIKTFEGEKEILFPSFDF